MRIDPREPREYGPVPIQYLVFSKTRKCKRENADPQSNAVLNLTSLPILSLWFKSVEKENTPTNTIEKQCNVTEIIINNNNDDDDDNPFKLQRRSKMGQQPRQWG